MIDVPLTLLKAGETFATETISLLPVVWVIGLLLCVDSDLPLLRSTTWRLLRNVIVALMALFLACVVVYAIYGSAVAVYFDDHGFTNLTLRTLSTMWVSIALALAGVVLWIHRRSRQSS